MNAALQCILSCDFIDSIYLKNKYFKILKRKQANSGDKKILTKKFAKFTKKMHQSRTSSPWSLKETFSSYHPSVCNEHLFNYRLHNLNGRINKL